MWEKTLKEWKFGKSVMKSKWNQLKIENGAVLQTSYSLQEKEMKMLPFSSSLSLHHLFFFLAFLPSLFSLYFLLFHSLTLFLLSFPSSFIFVYSFLPTHSWSSIHQNLLFDPILTFLHFSTPFDFPSNLSPFPLPSLSLSLTPLSLSHSPCPPSRHEIRGWLSLKYHDKL